MVDLRLERLSTRTQFGSATYVNSGCLLVAPFSISPESKGAKPLLAFAISCWFSEGGTGMFCSVLVCWLRGRLHTQVGALLAIYGLSNRKGPMGCPWNIRGLSESCTRLLSNLPHPSSIPRLFIHHCVTTMLCLDLSLHETTAIYRAQDATAPGARFMPVVSSKEAEV